MSLLDYLNSSQKNNSWTSYLPENSEKGHEECKPHFDNIQNISLALSTLKPKEDEKTTPSSECRRKRCKKHFLRKDKN